MAAPSRIPPSKTAPARTREETVISSRENRWLKLFRAALRASRPAENRIGLEGPHLVTEAIHSGAEIEAILVSASGEHHLEALREQLSPATAILRTSDKLFASVVATETPQGIAARARPRTFAFEDLLSGAETLIIVLAGVQDPGNIGTILRSAEAFGATGVIALRGSAHPYSPKALRAGAGSALRLPLIADLAPAVALTQFRVTELPVIAASPSAHANARQPDEMDLRDPFALLIGSEGAGLPPELERAANARIRIQLAEPVESLNAGVAASLILYEAARQRRANA